MKQRTLQDVARKFAYLMRTDPPRRLEDLPREPLAPVFDYWVATRFTWEEVNILFSLELEQGQEALAKWFEDVLAEAGVTSPSQLKT